VRISAVRHSEAYEPPTVTEPGKDRQTDGWAGWQGVRHRGRPDYRAGDGCFSEAIKMWARMRREFLMPTARSLRIPRQSAILQMLSIFTIPAGLTLHAGTNDEVPESRHGRVGGDGSLCMRGGGWGGVVA